MGGRRVFWDVGGRKEEGEGEEEGDAMYPWKRRRQGGTVKDVGGG